MAKIYAIVGEYNLAIEELTYALSLGGWSTPAGLRADPIFDPLSAYPRYQALLDKYENEQLVEQSNKTP